MTQKKVANLLVQSGLELSRAGKLFIGDGHVHRPVHDMSRLQGPRMLYRGCVVPPERIRGGVSGYTILRVLEHNELGMTQDFITEADGDRVMMATAHSLAKRLQRRLKESDVVPYPDRLIERGFCQRPYSTDEVFQGLTIGG